MYNVKEIMDKEPLKASPKHTIYHVAKMLLGNKKNVVIIDGLRPVSIISRRDLIREVIGQELDPEKVHVSDIMVRYPTIDSDTPIAKASKILSKMHIKQIPVVEDGQLVGILEHDHVTYAFIDILEEADKRVEKVDISVDEFHQISEQFYMLDGHLMEDPGKVDRFVKDIMSTNITMIPMNLSVLESSKIMGDLAIGCLIISDGKNPVGIVTEKDMIVKMILADKHPGKLKIGEIMTSPLFTIDPDLPIYELGILRKKKGFTKFPVMQHGKLIGIVTQSDLLKASLDLVKYMHWKILEKWDM